jgi:DNA repair protein RecO (recombination protein O)
MSRPRVYKTEAIVLGRTRLGEADRILTLFTPYLGKLRAVARGVRRSKSKLAGHLEPLTHCSIMLARGRNLDVITGSQTIASFMPLRDDLWRMGCGLYAAELTDQFTAEDQENLPVFQLLLESLQHLCQATRPELVLRFFELHLLNHVGYQPQLWNCLSCGAELNQAPKFFSSSGGGLLCPVCADTEAVVRPLSDDCLQALRFMDNEEMEGVTGLSLENSVSLEMERLISEYVEYILERRVKSVAFLDEMRTEAGERQLLQSGRPEDG